MPFEDISLKISYDSDDDDLLSEFYIPVLSNTIYYDRLTGYFSSSTFARSAKGMAKFIENGGRMRLITSTQFSESDIDAIQKGINSPEEVISQKFIYELENIEEQLTKDHVEALSWMVAEGFLEIKIAVVEKEYSIFHQKVGILNDGKNIISFNGSINETGKGWEDNDEEFTVYCSWKPGQEEYCAKYSTRFEKYWIDSGNNTRVYDLPTAIKQHLIKIAPKTKIEAIEKIKKIESKKPELYDFQQKALDSWFKSNKKGILEMATGTGKTRIAIACIKKLFQDADEPLLVVITCPQTNLVNQWINNLKDHGFNAKSAFEDSSKWLKDVGNDIHHLNNNVIKNLIVVTTHSTFPSQNFLEMIELVQSKIMIVADEVHSLAEKSRGGLLQKYDYRLALSATPKRYFDDHGTHQIFDFFGDVIFEFTIEEAIPKYLTPYKLVPHFIELTNDELIEYNEYSKKIAIQLQKKEITDQEIRELLQFMRQKIVKKAKNKILVLKEIISKESQLDHCLIYCADTDQLEDVGQVLHKENIIYRRFTTHESTKEREGILDDFIQEKLDMLVAIKCLDQGIDVPSTKIAIFMASTGNPIEFIQRRGRILRKFDGKDLAIIHDIIVTTPRREGSEYPDAEKTIVRKELERLKEFAEPAINSNKILPVIETLMREYQI